jgi:hypothetical protein
MRPVLLLTAVLAGGLNLIAPAEANGRHGQGSHHAGVSGHRSFGQPSFRQQSFGQPAFADVRRSPGLRGVAVLDLGLELDLYAHDNTPPELLEILARPPR